MKSFIYFSTHLLNTFYNPVWVLSCFSCVWLFATLWTVVCQVALPLGFSREEYWGGLPCPPPRHLPDPGIKSTYPVATALQADSLPLSHRGKPSTILELCNTKMNKTNVLPAHTKHTCQGLNLRAEYQGSAYTGEKCTQSKIRVSDRK